MMNFPNARKHSSEKGYRFVISQKYQPCDITDIPPIWYNDSVNSAYLGMLGNHTCIPQPGKYYQSQPDVYMYIRRNSVVTFADTCLIRYP